MKKILAFVCVGCCFECMHAMYRGGNKRVIAKQAGQAQPTTPIVAPRQEQAVVQVAAPVPAHISAIGHTFSDFIGQNKQFHDAMDVNKFFVGKVFEDLTFQRRHSRIMYTINLYPKWQKKILQCCCGEYIDILKLKEAIPEMIIEAFEQFFEFHKRLGIDPIIIQDQNGVQTKNLIMTQLRELCGDEKLRKMLIFGNIDVDYRIPKIGDVLHALRMATCYMSMNSEFDVVEDFISFSRYNKFVDKLNKHIDSVTKYNGSMCRLLSVRDVVDAMILDNEKSCDKLFLNYLESINESRVFHYANDCISNSVVLRTTQEEEDSKIKRDCFHNPVLPIFNSVGYDLSLDSYSGSVYSPGFVELFRNMIYQRRAALLMNSDVPDWAQRYKQDYLFKMKSSFVVMSIARDSMSRQIIEARRRVRDIEIAEARRAAEAAAAAVEDKGAQERAQQAANKLQIISMPVNTKSELYDITSLNNLINIIKPGAQNLQIHEVKKYFKSVFCRLLLLILSKVEENGMITPAHADLFSRVTIDDSKIKEWVACISNILDNNQTMDGYPLFASAVLCNTDYNEIHHKNKKDENLMKKNCLLSQIRNIMCSIDDDQEKVAGIFFSKPIAQYIAIQLEEKILALKNKKLKEIQIECTDLSMIAGYFWHGLNHCKNGRTEVILKIFPSLIDKNGFEKLSIEDILKILANIVVNRIISETFKFSAPKQQEHNSSTTVNNRIVYETPTVNKSIVYETAAESASFFGKVLYLISGHYGIRDMEGMLQLDGCNFLVNHLKIVKKWDSLPLPLRNTLESDGHRLTLGDVLGIMEVACSAEKFLENMMNDDFSQLTDILIYKYSKVYLMNDVKRDVLKNILTIYKYLS